MATNLSIYAPVDLVQQATVNFNGLLPSGALSTDHGRFIWAADANQGLYEPYGLGINTELSVIRIQLIMAGQSTWSVELLNGNGTATAYTPYTLSAGTTDSIVTIDTPCSLGYGQSLRITTLGAGTTNVTSIVTVMSMSYPFFR